jgi:hypothetical protein
MLAVQLHKKKPEEKFGLDCDPTDSMKLVIKTIKTGLVSKHNRSASSRGDLIHVGDRIMSVNGVSGDHAKMLQEVMRINSLPHGDFALEVQKASRQAITEHVEDNGRIQLEEIVEEESDSLARKDEMLGEESTKHVPASEASCLEVRREVSKQDTQEQPEKAASLETQDAHETKELREECGEALSPEIQATTLADSASKGVHAPSDTPKKTGGIASSSVPSSTTFGSAQASIDQTASTTHTV